MHAIVLCAAVTASSGAERASRAEAERLYQIADDAERDLKFQDALDAYEASVRVEPSNRFALRSTARARWLRDRSEGDFAPLVELERARRDPGAQGKADVVDALARDLENFPPGEVRLEARMYAAEAYEAKLGRPRDAERELDALLDEPKGDVPLRAQAALRLIDLAEARGDVVAAKHAAARVETASPTIAVAVAQWARRRILLRVAITLLSAFAAFGVFASARHLRGARAARLAQFAPKAALLCVYLASFAAILSVASERGHAVPFLLLPLAMFPIVMLARAWALSGDASRAARAARAVFGALAVASAAFIVLHQIDVRYLESFGL